jgi:hypothetical protein
MKRQTLLAAVALGALLPAAGPASAEETSCRVDALPTPKETQFPLLYQPRHDELTLEAGYRGSSFPMRSAFGFGATYNLALSDQRWHLGVRAVGALGSWGADGRGPFGFGAGLRVAHDLVRPLSGVVDVYALVQADALLAVVHGDPVVRPSLGLGVRAARTVALEASFDPLFAVGSPFDRDTRIAGGFGIVAAFDLCALGSWCNESPKTPTDLDLTLRMYDAASRTTPKDDARHDALCKAIELGLDAAKYPPHDQVDPTKAFLDGALDNVADDDTKKALRGLIEKHVAWRKQLLESREKARWAAAVGRQLEVHCIYSPFPVEIRSAFGCPGPAD